MKNDAPWNNAGELRWPLHLRDLCATFLREPPGPAKDQALGEAWLLVHTYMSLLLRIHGGTRGKVSREDREDLASERSLGFLRKIASREWSLEGRTPREIAGLISLIARHGLVDFLRGAGRRSMSLDDLLPEAEAAMTAAASGAQGRGIGGPAAPDEALERKEFASALAGCIRALPLRERRVWVLRNLCGLSSRETAAHPEIRLQRGHVDVLLMRGRRQVRDCMKRKGHSSADLPPGCFADLYDLLRESAPGEGKV